MVLVVDAFCAGAPGVEAFHGGFAEESPDGDFALIHGTFDFFVEEGVVEAGVGGVFCSVAEVDGAAARPVERGEAHGAGFAGGVNVAAGELKVVERAAGLAYGDHLGVGRGVECGGDLVGSAGDDFTVADDDAAEGAAEALRDVFCGEADGFAHEFGVGLLQNCLQVKSIADNDGHA